MGKTLAGTGAMWLKLNEGITISVDGIEDYPDCAVTGGKDF